MVQERARACLLAGVVTALAVALAIAGWIGWRQPGQAPLVPRGPLAAVLLPDVGSSALIVVDLGASRVVRRIALRSTVTDIALDASSGVVVAAQAGGFGADVDQAVSLTDPRTGAVRYVGLPAPDPGELACIDGRAYALHGVVEASGTVVSVVDVGAARVVATGNVAGPPGLWTPSGGALWTTADTLGSLSRVRRITPQGLSVRTLSVGTILPQGLSDIGGRLLIMGARGADDPAGAVAFVSAEDGAVEVSATVVGLTRAPCAAVRVGTRLLVGDWNGEEPETRALRALDAMTLKDLGEIAVDGIPCAIAAWEDRLVAVDRERGRLLTIDPVSGEVLASVDLGARGLVYSDVVVIDAPKAGQLP